MINSQKKNKLNSKKIKQLKSLEVFQIHKQPKNSKQYYHKITSLKQFHNIQIDFMDVINLHPVVNRKVRYLFNIIDVYSRYVWSYPITNKKSTTTADILNKWLKLVKIKYNKKPINLNSDDGNEFKGKFKILLKIVLKDT